MPKKLTTEEIVSKFKQVHGDKYDYSLVVYKGSKTEVEIICPTHGVFRQTPNNHLKPQDCPLCKHRGYKYTKEEYINVATLKHNGKYDYSLVDYNNIESEIQIICPTHGVFSQNAHNHLRGSGCPDCAGRKRKTKEAFERDARKIHGDKYNYSLVEYISNKKEVNIICPKHGVFPQKPNKHLLGEGCPSCKHSKLEEEISVFLKFNNIDFKEQYNRQWLGLQRLDFYLPKYNIAIECQGEQHFIPIEGWGGETTFASIVKRDELKAKKCKENLVRILYYGNKQHQKYDTSLITDKNKLLEEILKSK